jgi:hypothetical protein
MQEKGAAVCQLEAASLRFQSAGKRALFMAEKLALNQAGTKTSARPKSPGARSRQNDEGIAEALELGCKHKIDQNGREDELI